jgi:hypothetical protein
MTWTVLLLACVACAARGNVVLVEGRTARAVVVTADEPAPIAEYAARELVHHVELATGVRLAVARESDIPAQPAGRVYVGATTAARKAGIDPDALPAEVTVLRTAGNALFIVGHDGPDDPLSETNIWSGTLWGVYELLEGEMGVRWLWPGELGTHVPKSERVVIGEMDRRIAPRFEIRRARPTTRDNNPRNGFTEDGRLRYLEAERVFMRRHRMGRSHNPTPYSTGHSFSNWWQQYGQQHPEWFQLRADGTRGPGNAAGARVAMCLTSPGLHQEIVRRFTEERKLHPDRPPILSIGENDVHDMCACENCQAWDDPFPTADELKAMPRYVRSSMQRPGGARYARFWKTVYEKLREVDPNVVVTAFAYSHYFPAPQQKIELDPHIIISFVPWMPHTPVPAPGDDLTPTVYPPGGHRAWFFPRYPEEQRWVMEQWDRWRATGASLYYRPNHTFNGYAMPHLYSRQYAEVFQHYAANGLKGTDFDSFLGQWAAQGPMLYLLFRLHTRPGDNVDDLLGEYYASFGPAAPRVREYFDYWERHTTEKLQGLEALLVRYGVHELANFPRMAHEMFPPAAFTEGNALLARAEAAVAKDKTGTYRDRVAFLRDGLTHAQLCARVAAAFADKDVPAEQRRARLDELGAFRREKEGSFIANYHWLQREENSSWKGMAGYFEE